MTPREIDKILTRKLNLINQTTTDNVVIFTKDFQETVRNIFKEHPLETVEVLISLVIYQKHLLNLPSNNKPNVTESL